jgi:nucleotide-binding universal stress UspA family protein
MFKSIVVGTDGSPTATRAVERAVELAELCGAEVHLVTAHAADRAKVSVGRSVAPEAADWHVDPDFKAEAVLERAAGLFRGSGVEPERHAPRGDAADALLRVAEECGADLILVGNRGMTGARRMLGSVPNKVSHHAGCAVMIVPTA